MKALRDPKSGCPWDLKQNHETLLPYFWEELCEFQESIQDPNIPQSEREEELGDLLFQTVFHAHLMEENGGAGFDQIALRCANKLRERHPHVFGQKKFQDEEELRQFWEQNKAKKSQKSMADSVSHIPKSLPPLLRSQRIGDKAAGFNFDWKNSQEVFEKVREEFRELEEAKSDSDAQEELGDLLFVLAQYARKNGWNSDAILKKANNKFLGRFRKMEDLCERKNLNWNELTDEKKENLWKEIKRQP